MDSKEKSIFLNEIMQSLHEALISFESGKLSKEDLEKKYFRIMNAVMRRSKEWGVKFALKHHSLEFTKGYDAGLNIAIECIKQLPLYDGDAKYVLSRNLGDNLYIEKQSLIDFISKQKF